MTTDIYVYYAVYVFGTFCVWLRCGVLVLCCVKVVLILDLFVTFVLLVSYSIVEGVFFFNLFWLPVVGC